MIVDVLTLFPQMFEGFRLSIIKRAIEKGLLDLNFINIRDFSKDKHNSVDGHPYGGGAGMVMMCQPLFDAVNSVVKKDKKERVILLDPQGKTFNQKAARRLSKYQHLILICGHYEGIDQRIKDSLVDEMVSIGDYVLTGGEVPAMAVIDSITRLLPGVLKQKSATTSESFSLTTKDRKQLLEFPQYTRPEMYKGQKVPKVLLSGNHTKIEEWRQEKAKELTLKNRPDLLKAKI